MLKLQTQRDGTVRLSVKVVPGASRDKIVGELGDALKVAVTAAPEQGAANRAVIELLSAALGVHRSQIAIARGHTSPRKEVSVSGITSKQIAAAIAAKQ